MPDSTTRARPDAPRAATPEGGHETERQRPELPEWLAKELFKIFV